MKWITADRFNNKAQLALMGFKPENIYEFNEASLDELKEGHTTISTLIKAHAKAKERVFLYCYVAGHGCANVRQFFVLDSSNPLKTLYPIEEKLRVLSINGRGYAYCFGVYDICR